jgi:outer membrane protein assembly factor BamB
MHLNPFFRGATIRSSLVVIALLALPVAACSTETCPPGSTEAACIQRFAPIREATPMPRQTPEELGIEPFVGEAVVANPLTPLDIPEHPLLDNGGDSRVHNDHYNSASYPRSGPVGPAIDVTTNQLGSVTGVCAMMTMLKNGYVVGSCLVSDGGAGVNVMLFMFDNLTLDIVAEQNVGLRPFVANSAGGAYFSLDADENILIGPATNKLEQYHIEVIDGAPQFVRDYSKEIPGLPPAQEATDPMLQDTVLDYDGRLWFMVTDGRVGYYDIEADVIEITDLGRGLENSMVVDDRGVYLVTVGATVRVSAAEDGSVRVDWEAEYDAGEGTGLLPGSGSSPTLLGTEDDLISIADNAAEQINLLVLDREDGSTKCEVPVFTKGASGTENTVIGYDDDIVIVNNAGFGGPFAPANTIEPGIERYRVLRDGDGEVTGCELVWSNPTSFGNSAQLGAESGVIWGYGADPAVTDEDLFYLTATSWEMGDEIFRAYVGDGKDFDPITGQVHIHPDGSLFLGALRGVVLMRDVAP